MARPKKQYTVQLEPETIEAIDKLAEKHSLTRSQIMRNLIVTGLEDAMILDKVGALKLAQVTDQVVTKIKELFQSGKVRVDKEGRLNLIESDK
ncbi:MAG TPA: ribbon-helix-helix protein, CopG family [Syntrophales bacterium]|mgnify:CR=1 FL=1|nr:ribbon-helix-helix protein, CopG family [Syntrophales bacterium]